ncbi:hypothetical protein AB0E01_16750 [Nocardia vinacea]|uniref:hypothetical protein n=1 Tax=Nocardia vinacea TaxID=96468 RepID=UPI0033D9389A
MRVELFDWSVPALAAIATASETLLAIGLILGIAAKLTARAAAVVLIAFAAAMWTSVGFDEMCSYGVLVVAGGAALLGNLRHGRVPRKTVAPHTLSRGFAVE